MSPEQLEHLLVSAYTGVRDAYDACSELEENGPEDLTRTCARLARQSISNAMAKLEAVMAVERSKAEERERLTQRLNELNNGGR